MTPEVPPGPTCLTIRHSLTQHLPGASQRPGQVLGLGFDITYPHVLSPHREAPSTRHVATPGPSSVPNVVCTASQYAQCQRQGRGALGPMAARHPLKGKGKVTSLHTATPSANQEPSPHLIYALLGQNSNLLQTNRSNSFNLYSKHRLCPRTLWSLVCLLSLSWVRRSINTPLR